MAPFFRLVLAALVVIGGSFAFSLQTSTGFAVSRAPVVSVLGTSATQQKPKLSQVLLLRGGVSARMSTTGTVQAKKMRISAFDSLRFFLITTIVLGHFISFANPSSFVLKLVSQHNLAAGAFFALSGYVTAYTTSENSKREASPKFLQTSKQKWVLSRIFGYYPLHLVVLLLFSPMFLFVDVTYNGWPRTVWHGFLSLTLTQAWFPDHAEIWNAPTWYLSALSFVTMIIPFGIPAIAKMDKKQLRRTAGWLSLSMVLPKIGYLYDLDAWNLVESMIPPKSHPNWSIFNIQRFCPLYQAAEVFLGAVCCRLVMLDDDPDIKEKKPATSALSTLVPVVCLIGSSVLRATGNFTVSEFVARYLVFVPMFLRLLMAVHRNKVNSVDDPVCSLLNNRLLVTLGRLSFPIYIVHGPIGQLFFKKLVAKKLFGQVLSGPTNFAIYLASVLVSAIILQRTVVENSTVEKWSSKTVDMLSSWT